MEQERTPWGQIGFLLGGVALLIFLLMQSRPLPVEQIAFSSNRDGNYEIYLLDVNSGVVQRVTQTPFDENSPVISPDGQQIAYDAPDSGDPSNQTIYVMNRDGSAAHEISNYPGSHFYPTWKADGSQLTFTSTAVFAYGVFRINLNGTGTIRFVWDAGTSMTTTWAPDGTRFAYALTSIDSGYDIHEIYARDLTTSTVYRLSQAGAIDFTPNWSPDGKRIVFASKRDGNMEIYVMNADGSNPQRLTSDASRDMTPHWLSDSQRIVFVSDRDGNSELYLVNADGSGLKRLTDNPADDVFARIVPSDGVVGVLSR